MRGLRVEDVLRIVSFDELDASRKGWAAFIVSRADIESNRTVRELYVTEPQGVPRLVSSRNPSLPRWNPDGVLLAYTSTMKDDGKRRVKVMVWGGGEPREVAGYEHPVTHLDWLDNGTLVVARLEPVKGMYDEDYVATDRLPLWFDGSGLVAGYRSVVEAVDVWSGVSKRLSEEDERIGSMTACKGRIYYTVPTSWRNPLCAKLVALDPRGGERRVVVEGYSIGQVRCIDGRLYILAHRCERGLATHYRLWVLDEDGEPLCLTCSLNRNVWSAAGSLEGSPLIVYADSGSAVLAVVEGERVRDLAGRKGFVHLASGSGGLAYYVASSPTTPPELYVYDATGSRKVTAFNEWLTREVNLREPERVVVEAEGEPVEGWVLLPEGEGPHPLILYIHGGPKAMYGYRFEPEMQLMVSHGFAVAYANPRGSDGYSEDFADIRGGYGEKDYRQLLAFLDTVLERYPVDRSRVGVTGISYGGYMTNIMVARSPERFRAAVSENGIADWIADYWASDIGYWFDPDQLGGTPLDNLEEYVRRSPAYMLPERVWTAVLIIHSMEDYRCFIDQALAMHAALLARGAVSRLVVFRRGSHAHSVKAEPRHRRKRLELKLEWFEKHLKG